MSLIIFMIYAIQRGLATLAKSGLAVEGMSDALGIYFTTMSIVVLIGGYILDNVRSRPLILGCTIAGVLGILGLSYTPWAFGLVFGACAAIFKLIPFTSPLKIKDGNDALRIAPQASAKNFGSVAFMLFLGSALIYLGWDLASAIMAVAFGLIGIFAFYTAPNDKIEGWKPTIFIQLAKSVKFWLFMIYMFFMCGWYYIAIMQYFPAIKGLGFGKMEVLYILSIAYIIAGGLRWVWGWISTAPYAKETLMVIGTLGLGLCTQITHLYPIISLGVFAVVSSIHTPIYWAYAKEHWGKKYLGTVVALGFFFMYLGAGVMYGKW